MYYLLETDYSIEPTAYRTSSLVTEFKFKASRWVTGREIGEPKNPIAVEFWKNGGNGCAEMMLDSIPLFTEKLVSTLQKSGVDNLQIFPITTVERDGDSVDEEYVAVNIIGCMSCDEATTNGLQMFRIPEAITSIVIHENVKRDLEKQNYGYLKFRPL